MATRIERARARIQTAAGYSIAEDRLLIEALDTTGLRTPQANRRLALLGDMLLRAVIVDEWFFTGKPTGVADARLQSIAGNTNLARAGRIHGLDDHVTTHPGHRGPVSNKTLATTVEAVLGAIFLDSGKDLTAVKDAMETLGLIV